MGINEIVIYIMVFFMAIGALDKCIGNLVMVKNLKKELWLWEHWLYLWSE